MAKTLLYKNGDPEVFRYFTDETLKHMTTVEKAMWTPYSDNEPAAIPADVIDFQNKQNEANERIKKLEEENKKLKEQAESQKTDPEKTDSENTEKIELTDEEAEKKAIRTELENLGVRVAYNTGLPKLREKLKEAQNANPGE